jgi:hypothetical protein
MDRFGSKSISFINSSMFPLDGTGIKLIVRSIDVCWVGFEKKKYVLPPGKVCHYHPAAFSGRQLVLHVTPKQPPASHARKNNRQTPSIFDTTYQPQVIQSQTGGRMRILRIVTPAQPGNAN